MRLESFRKSREWMIKKVVLPRGLAVALAVSAVTGGILLEKTGTPDAVAGFIGSTANTALYESRKLISEGSFNFSKWTDPGPRKS